MGTMDTKEKGYMYMWLLVLRFMLVVLGELRLHNTARSHRPNFRALVQLETDIVRCYRSVEADLYRGKAT